MTHSSVCMCVFAERTEVAAKWHGFMEISNWTFRKFIVFNTQNYEFYRVYDILWMVNVNANIKIISENRSDVVENWMKTKKKKRKKWVKIKANGECMSVSKKSSAYASVYVAHSHGSVAHPLLCFCVWLFQFTSRFFVFHSFVQRFHRCFHVCRMLN